MSSGSLSFDLQDVVVAQFVFGLLWKPQPNYDSRKEVVACSFEGAPGS